MAKLNIRLLGPFQAELDGQILNDFRSDKVRGLLAFLAVESQRRWSRSYLADFFWPDYPEEKAQSNLSNALWNLRSVIGDIKENTEFIIVKKSTLQFNPKSDYWLDVKIFQELINKFRMLTSPEEKSSLSDLEEALSLSRDRFMEGFTIDSPGFETWLVKTRQDIHRKRIQTLRWISIRHMLSSNLSTALDYTRDWIAQEPWDERACRLTMQILEKLGQRKKALEEFERCRKRLAEDLGIEPQPETVQLYEQMKGSPLPSRSFPEPTSTRALKKEGASPGPAPQFLREAAAENISPSPFFARQKELEQLDKWLAEVQGGQGRAAFIKGEPGSGKTTLLTEFAHRCLEKYPDLLLLWGQCNAYTGHGDPYFPFMTMTRMLAGNLEPLVPGAVISLDHLERLWRSLPDMLKSLVEQG